MSTFAEFTPNPIKQDHDRIFELYEAIIKLPKLSCNFLSAFQTKSSLGPDCANTVRFA